ncbi:MAG TPA: hypothetical protein VLT36_02110, partial [Candidatus Dormibacteraeota bacterium]|nr:hypothetical protein [Candidatus Dormibacteraeota bacterium]
YAYPRDEQELTFQITPWRTNRASTVKFRNPKRFSPREWAGLPLPQTNKTAAVEFVLTALTMRTNGGPKGYWQTRTRFWEPAWEFRQDGKPAAGWADPEWTAEDAWGNRGKFLGVHQPVLRFSATVYPEATNTRSASLVATLPQVSPSLLTTNVWWNQPCKMSSNEFMAMGICTPGVHVFCDGKYDTNSPAGMGPVSGGAPSGWTGQSRRINPLQVKVQTGHYTPLPTVYIHAPDLQPPLRLGLRLRDTNGLFWAAEPEKQGSSQGVHAFLVKLPTNVTEVLPELVLLKPVVTEFLVRTSPQK